MRSAWSVLVVLEQNGVQVATAHGLSNGRGGAADADVPTDLLPAGGG